MSCPPFSCSLTPFVANNSFIIYIRDQEPFSFFSFCYGSLIANLLHICHTLNTTFELLGSRPMFLCPPILQDPELSWARRGGGSFQQGILGIWGVVLYSL